MANEPFIARDDRPDLTLDMEGKVGELTVRELASILGFDLQEAELKEGKSENKDHKDSKDSKDTKDSFDQKQQKDQKDSKDHKEEKDWKDQKEQKDLKDSKDHKDRKDHKDHTEVKVNRKELVKEVTEGKRFTPEKGPEIGPGVVESPSELDQLVKRVSGLEQSIEELKRAMK
jgi:hypothetical protein